MRPGTLLVLGAAVLAAVAATDAIGPATTLLEYDVVGLDGKLWLEGAAEPTRLAVGDRAVSGDRLRTGSSSRAQLHVASHATGFLLGSKTSCTLAHDRPGVLLHLERGRLRAVFEALAGAEPRLVTTPSAVLAVRGTELGVEVSKNGTTRIVVFAGVVEVSDPAGAHPPVMVEAGQQTRVAPSRPPAAPTPNRVSPEDWDRGRAAPPPSATGSGFERVSPDGGAGAEGAGAEAGRGGSKRRGG
jgi:hypothetical protein